MATHSSTLAWKIPWMEEPGSLQSLGSWRIGHDWVTSLSLFTFMHWRRKWQPTSVFLPGESQGQKSLVGCCFWGRTELGTTEATQQQQQQPLLSKQGIQCVRVAKSLCNPMDCQAPLFMDFRGKNIGVGGHSFSRGSSLSTDRTHVSCLAGGWILYHCAIWEAQGFNTVSNCWLSGWLNTDRRPDHSYGVLTVSLYLLWSYLMHELAIKLQGRDLFLAVI